MKTARRKRCIEVDEQDGSRLSDQVSGQAKVARNATKCVVKEEITAEVSTVAVNDRSRQCKQQSAMKRKRASSADVPESIQGQADSKVMCDSLPSRRRKTAKTAVQHNKPLQEDKPPGQSVNKSQRSLKQQQTTCMRKSASEAQEKKSSKKPLPEIDADRKKSTKVKHESPVKTVDTTSVKTEIPDVPFTSPSYHSSRKFVGAHVSISGMPALCCNH